MARKFENDKGFLIIKLSKWEMLSISSEIVYCELCDAADDEGYLICGIKQYYCENCFTAWYETAIRYKPDIKQEEKNYLEYVKELKNLNLWEE